jgi:hypothetical protein
MDLTAIILSAMAFALGGLLKGATGAGAPVVGGPVLAVFVDVRFAVAVFAIPNLLTNLSQGWRYRSHQGSRTFVVKLAVAGLAGAAAGTLLLAWLPSNLLMGIVAVIVLVYVVFRLMRPSWQLSRTIADRIVLPVGLLGGAMQGAGGISAPVSITFLNAIGMSRPEFIATISVFFAAMSVAQVPMLAALGLMTREAFFASLLALIPMFVFMPVGEWLAKHISKSHFDRVTLLLLIAIAFKLIHDAVA